jgi:aminotransferase
MMAILENAHLHATPPEGAYYVLADFGEWAESLQGRGGEDDFAFADYMTTQVGVAVVPGSSFYRTPGLGKAQVRFAFAKKLETLDAAEERLMRARP